MRFRWMIQMTQMIRKIQQQQLQRQRQPQQQL